VFKRGLTSRRKRKKKRGERKGGEKGESGGGRNGLLTQYTVGNCQHVTQRAKLVGEGWGNRR
jgi:hypothetical protein